MNVYTCSYITSDGTKIGRSAKIRAENAVRAAAEYSERFPGTCSIIRTENFWDGRKDVPNPVANKLAIKRREQEKAQRESRQAEEDARAKEQIATQEKQLLDSLQELHSSVERAGGEIAELSYSELRALLANLRDFPALRDKVGREERLLRENLYKVAFFDRDLQAGLQAAHAEIQTKEAELQTEIQRELLGQIKSALTGQATAGAAGSGKSNLAAAAALGGMAALQKLNQIEENTGDVSEGLGFD